MTEAQIELDDSARQEIDRTLREAYKTGYTVEITHFVPDEQKEGGKHVATAGLIKTIDSENRMVEFQNKVKIEIDSIQSAVRM